VERKTQSSGVSESLAIALLSVLASGVHAYAQRYCQISNADHGMQRWTALATMDHYHDHWVNGSWKNRTI